MADAKNSTTATTKDATEDGAKGEILVKWKSPHSNHRRELTKKDWASIDVKMDKNSVWEKRNNWTLTATDWPASALSYVEGDSSFTVERH